jgi:hypothetical protein
MSVITLAIAERQLSAWVEADATVASGQSYSIGGRSLTRANASEITDKIEYWKNVVAKINNGGGVRMQRIVPRDI